MVANGRTQDANKVVTGRFMEEFKNQHIFAVIDELFISQGDRSPPG